MLDLLAAFTPLQILTFVILFSLAVKGIQDLIDFFKGKYKEKFNKDHQKITRDEELDKHYQVCIDQHKETLELYNMVSDKLDDLSNSIKELDRRVDRLTVSDRNDIKQYIVREYHYFVEEKKWIDDYSLDSILQRFEDYKAEGGNTYVHTLVEEIKKLPKCPPT